VIFLEETTWYKIALVFVDVLKEYKDVISAVLGVVVGSAFTLLWKSFGTIKTYKKSFDYQFSKQNSMGEMAKAEGHEAEMFSVDFSIEVLNSSEVVFVNYGYNFLIMKTRLLRKKCQTTTRLVLYVQDVLVMKN
jgi:hypothetical protein